MAGKKKTNQDIIQLEIYKQTVDKMRVHVYWKDVNFRYIDCNLLQAQDLGLKSANEIVGKTDYDFYSESDANKIRKNDIQVFSSGVPCVFEEDTFIAHKGHTVYLTQKVPITDDTGQIIGLAGISFDITARQREQELLNKDKEDIELTLSSILDNLPGHVYWKNTDSVYQGCNWAQARSAGLSNKQDMIGKTDFDMPWREQAKQLKELDQAVIQNKQTLTREELSQLEGSDHVSVFLSKKSPMFNKQGEVIGILGISFDITDRKKLEEDLRIAKEAAEAAARAKTEFIANMSHDLRTPLAGVITASEILEHKALSPEEKEFAEMIHESGSELLAFINGILDDSIADNVHEHEMVEGEVDLKNMLRVIEKLELPAIKTKHLQDNDDRRIELKVELEPEVPQVVITDGKKLERILLNLIGNAIKFTDQGSITVRIKALSREQNVSQLQFSVADTGIGIPDEAQSKVFDEFFKVSPSSKGLYKGYGKGLAIAKKYVELLGGKMTLVSHLGEGTAFYFTLSLKMGNQPKGESIPHATEQAIVAEGNNPLCLLVDDNRIALRCLETLITEAKCPSFSAGSAEEALELIKSHPFVCMITDLGLPGLSGIELTQRVRAWEKEQNKKPLLIVGLSAAVDQATRDACLKAGMNDVFMKPITPEGLKMILKNMPR